MFAHICTFCWEKYNHTYNILYPNDKICTTCGSNEVKEKLTTCIHLVPPLVKIIIKFVDHEMVEGPTGATGPTGNMGIDIRCVDPDIFSSIKTFEDFLVFFKMEHSSDYIKEQMRPFIESTIKARKK